MNAPTPSTPGTTLVKTAGFARRLRATAGSSSDMTAVGTVVCDKCGQRFVIRNEPAVPSADVAEKQAAWVADQLVWDHIQERKHHGNMALPDALQESARPS